MAALSSLIEDSVMVAPLVARARFVFTPLVVGTKVILPFTSGTEVPSGNELSLSPVEQMVLCLTVLIPESTVGGVLSMVTSMVFETQPLGPFA